MEPFEVSLRTLTELRLLICSYATSRVPGLSNRTGRRTEYDVIPDPLLLNPKKTYDGDSPWDVTMGHLYRDTEQWRRTTSRRKRCDNDPRHPSRTPWSRESGGRTGKRLKEKRQDGTRSLLSLRQNGNPSRDILLSIATHGSFDLLLRPQVGR